MTSRSAPAAWAAAAVVVLALAGCGTNDGGDTRCAEFVTASERTRTAIAEKLLAEQGQDPSEGTVRLTVTAAMYHCASPDAAVSQAAHDVLVALLPTQRAAFDAALDTIMATLPSAAARDGATVGAAAAAAVLELRTGDGWERPFPPLDLPSLPGYWRPTPPAKGD